MATATARDDDLLIIADDSASDSSSDDIEFSFDFAENSTETKEENSVEEISVETPTETMDSIEEIKEVTPVTTDTNIDLGINFDTPSEENKSEVVAETHEVPTEEFSFDLGEVSETKEENIADETKKEEVISTAKIVTDIETTGSTGDDTSMNDILSGTIAKLAARQDVIATDKTGKTKKEEEIKAQIKELQTQVKGLEADMKALDNESDKITANITELENMKLDPVKEHNANRTKK